MLLFHSWSNTNFYMNSNIFFKHVDELIEQTSFILSYLRKKKEKNHEKKGIVEDV